MLCVRRIAKDVSPFTAISALWRDRDLNPIPRISDIFTTDLDHCPGLTSGVREVHAGAGNPVRIAAFSNSELRAYIVRSWAEDAVLLAEMTRFAVSPEGDRLLISSRLHSSAEAAIKAAQSRLAGIGWAAEISPSDDIRNVFSLAPGAFRSGPRASIC